MSGPPWTPARSAWPSPSRFSRLSITGPVTGSLTNAVCQTRSHGAPSPVGGIVLGRPTWMDRSRILGGYRRTRAGLAPSDPRGVASCRAMTESRPSSHPIHVGLKFSQQLCTIEQQREVWRIADEAGFDHLWNFDHFHPIGGAPLEGDIFDG